MAPAELFDQLRAHPLVRRAAWLGFLSLISAITLTGYVFGLSEGFFGRAISAALVLWLLALGTALGILPLVRWGTHKLAGRATPARGRRTAPPVARSPRARPPVARWR